MSTKANGKKRALEGDAAGMTTKKRAQQSTTTKSTVANFFQSTSVKKQQFQEEARKIKWEERAPTSEKGAVPTLLVAHYQPDPQTAQAPHAKDNADAKSTSAPTSPSTDSMPKLEASSSKRLFKIAAFDLDSTLITTASGKKHASEATDWTWWHASVPERLRQLHTDEHYTLVIFSNQAGITIHGDSKDTKKKTPSAAADARLGNYRQKCQAILNTLDLPIRLYAATEKDRFRKPRTGMWHEFLQDSQIDPSQVDLQDSFFVGDAGGRIAGQAQTPRSSPERSTPATSKGKKSGKTHGLLPKDFSCSDRNMAHNIGIRFFTPEAFFLGEDERPFQRDFDLATYLGPEAQDIPVEKVEQFVEVESDVRETQAEITTSVSIRPVSSKEKTRQQLEETKQGETEVIVLCGAPGAGKSTFFRQYFEPLGYQRINQDQLKSRDKCIKTAQDHLSNGQSIVIDNTNADPDTRALWIDMARKAEKPVRCIWLRTPLAVCEHNDAIRSMNPSLNPEQRTRLPKIAFNGYNSRFKPPTTREGFHRVIPIDFCVDADLEIRKIWAQYWV